MSADRLGMVGADQTLVGDSVPDSGGDHHSISPLNLVKTEEASVGIGLRGG
jgi:hypothetical protein